MDGGNLRFAGGNGNGSGRIRLPDLAADPLHHGLIVSVLCPKNLDELLGTDVVRQRPQPLAGTARQ